MPQGNIKLKTTEKKFENAELLPEIIKLLNEGHSVTLLLRGYSMRPFLEDKRDKALLVKATEIKKGMPVLAETNLGHYVLHRVIEISGNDVVLRGDGNIGVEHCKLSNIKGEAIGFYRKGRKKLDMTSSWKWKVYSLIWTRLLPIRRYLLAAYKIKLRIMQ